MKMNPTSSMGVIPWPPDPTTPLIIDSSVAISLTGTGFCLEIAEAIPNPILVEDTVRRELSEGRRSGRTNIDLLEELAAKDLVQIVHMGNRAMNNFEELVIGNAADTLDDGEAATIAYATTERAIAVIDERKAIRICSERFPNLHLASTGDLLAHPEIEKNLEREAIRMAVGRALKDTRMRVLPHNQAWVLDVIGEDAVFEYPSLSKSVRLGIPKVMQ